MIPRLIGNCKSLFALAQWVTGKPDQTYVLITTDDSRIRVVASTNITTEGVRDLVQLGLNKVNEQLKKEMCHGRKR